jgi:HEAT repeat protein
MIVAFSAPMRRLPLFLAGICFIGLAARSTCAQDPPAPEQQQAQLAAADEETRINALIGLSALLPLRPGAAMPTTIAALIQALQNDASPVARALAARALALTSDPQALTALLAALDRERELAARKAIIYALARFPQPSVTAALIPLLKHKQAELRSAVAYALAEIADPAAADALTEMLRKRRGDQDAFARSEAARGLGRSGAMVASALLVTALTSDKSLEVRREAAAALGRLGSKQDAAVIAALKTATLAADPYLSRAAAAALEQIQER